MISVAAYLEHEKVADLRSEYVDGRCLPVVGASRVHDMLSMRLTHLFNRHLKETRCRVYRPAVKLHIRTPQGDRFYYPDLQVACGEHDALPEFLDSPKLVLEVLSPSSEERDREEKATAYQRIPSLEELVLVAHDASRIELRRRRSGWEPASYEADERLHLESIDLELSVGEVYVGVDIEAHPRPAGAPVLSIVRQSGAF